ncbi:hypothetical protein ACYCCF_20680 [Streptomyces argenteolus]|uniref:hypothetical protein n=1 Tax=Streptomyces sp. NPDC025273 TaxID=3155251 RepID=UPI0033ED421E
MAARSRSFAPHGPARCERDAAYAAETLREAVTLLVGAAGTPGPGDGHAPQRFRRDITTATGQVALRYDTAAREHHAAVLPGPGAREARGGRRNG